MNTPFKNGYKVTQVFGARPEYYGQFGFDGHEGVDLIPLDSDWNMYCIEDGTVIRDYDDPRTGGAYGNYALVWNEENCRGWWYCHMSKNAVYVGQEVKRGDLIGVMGETGNTDGAHLHLGLRYGNENKEPINTDNGYKGFVDPLPVLKELNMEGEMPLKNTNIDWYDYEGNQHTVGWYVYEWELEKRNGIKLASDIADLKEFNKDLQKQGSELTVQLTLAREAIQTSSDNLKAVKTQLVGLEQQLLLEQAENGVKIENLTKKVQELTDSNEKLVKKNEGLVKDFLKTATLWDIFKVIIG
jgi:hypothetical protein